MESKKRKKIGEWLIEWTTWKQITVKLYDLVNLMGLLVCVNL